MTHAADPRQVDLEDGLTPPANDTKATQTTQTSADLRRQLKAAEREEKEKAKTKAKADREAKKAKEKAAREKTKAKERAAKDKAKAKAKREKAAEAKAKRPAAPKKKVSSSSSSKRAPKKKAPAAVKLVDGLNPRGRYGVARELARAFERTLGGIDLDVCFDPEQVLRAREGFSIHLPKGKKKKINGCDVLGVDSLDPKTPWPLNHGHRTIYCNPDFSGGGTKNACQHLADSFTPSGPYGNIGVDAAIYVGPANLGADYFESLWPLVVAIAHVGRYDFVPLVDMPETDKQKSRKKGVRSSGGSSLEVAAVLLAAHPRPNNHDDQAKGAADLAKAFAREMRPLGIYTTVRADLV